MSFLGLGDIPAMLSILKNAGGTVSVTVGGVTVDALQDIQAEELLKAEMPGVSAARKVILVQTGALPAATQGVVAVVAGENYKIADITPTEDGAFNRLVLRR